MAGATSLDTLPEELLGHIFSYLELIPPSVSKARHEPSLELTDSATAPLKSVCCVSKRWRRIVLPLLFRYSRLRIDSPQAQQHDACLHCNPVAGTTDGARHRNISSLHAALANSAREQIPAFQECNFKEILQYRSEKDPHNREAMSALRGLHFWHKLYGFITFVTLNGLTSGLESFVLIADSTSVKKFAGFAQRSARWQLLGAAVFWRCLLSVVDPARVMIVAPPLELACLTNAVIDISGVCLLHVAISAADFSTRTGHSAI